jgi:DNA-binding PadR family transcriptional regulator
VLAFLATRAMSDLEIRREFEEHEVENLFGARPDSIGRTLRGLQREGLVEPTQPPDLGGSAGIVYRITEPGREELDALVAQTSTQSGHLLSIVDAALTLGWLLDHIRRDGCAG